MANLRLFLALVPSSAFLEALEPFRGELLRAYADLRLVPRHSLHLTLKFLGQVDEAKLSEVVACLGRGLSAAKRAHLSFDRLISMPSVSKAKVVAMAGDYPPLLGTLVESLEESLETLAFPREVRPFRAHLTLGRAKGRARLRQDHAPIPPRLSFEATEVLLFQSWLEPQGSRYEARARFPLMAP